MGFEPTFHFWLRVMSPRWFQTPVDLANVVRLPEPYYQDLLWTREEKIRLIFSIIELNHTRRFSHFLLLQDAFVAGDGFEPTTYGL